MLLFWSAGEMLDKPLNANFVMFLTAELRPFKFRQKLFEEFGGGGGKVDCSYSRSIRTTCFLRINTARDSSGCRRYFNITLIFFYRRKLVEYRSVSKTFLQTAGRARSRGFMRGHVSVRRCVSVVTVKKKCFFFE